MTVDQTLERISKVLAALGEIAKLTLIVGLIWLGYIVIAHPDKLKHALAGLQGAGVSVDKWEANLPFVKISGSVFNAAEAVATAQAKLVAAQAASPSPAAAAELRTVSASLAQVQTAVAQQAREVRAAGARAGIVENVPATGWIYVGFIAANGFKKLSDRIDPKDAQNLKLEGGKVTGLARLTLVLDASLAQGEECVRVSIDSLPNGAAAEALLPKVMLEHDVGKPLEVVRAETCKAAGDGAYVWAEVKVPAERVLALARR